MSKTMRRLPFSREQYRAIESIKRRQTSRRRQPQARFLQQAQSAVPQNETQLLNLEIAQALARFLLAPDWVVACAILQQHPILLIPSATEVLVSMVVDAQIRQDEGDELVLRSHLAILEHVRTRGVPAVLRELRHSP